MIDLAEITHKIIILSSFRHPPSYTDELTQFLKNDPFDNQYKDFLKESISALK